MAISVERYITVCHPFFKLTHNWSARRYVLPILVLCMVYNVPKYFELQVHSNESEKQMKLCTYFSQLRWWINFTSFNEKCQSFTRYSLNQIVRPVCFTLIIWLWKGCKSKRCNGRLLAPKCDVINANICCGSNTDEVSKVFRIQKLKVFKFKLYFLPRMNKIYILCYIMWSNVVVNGKGIIIYSKNTKIVHFMRFYSISDSDCLECFCLHTIEEDAGKITYLNSSHPWQDNKDMNVLINF